MVTIWIKLFLSVFSVFCHVEIAHHFLLALIAKTIVIFCIMESVLLHVLMEVTPITVIVSLVHLHASLAIFPTTLSSVSAATLVFS